MSATSYEYSENPYNEGPYGTLDFIDQTNIYRLQNQWSNDGVPLDADSNIKRLLRSIGTALDYFDQRAAYLKTQTNVVEADGSSLDNIGYLANVHRKTNEPDEKYRIRIIATVWASLSGATFDEVARFTAYVLDTDVTNVTLRPVEHEPLVRIRVDGTLIEQSPFTADEIANLCNRVIPLDSNCIFELSGTFRFKDIGAEDDPSKGFTTLPADEDVGGTLSGNVSKSDTE
ncbi:hypothetical protein [Halococcus sp. IIIV-5B]|uniref:hypothetical protein n=1 Tax=Halococcus sp. IIIV-5B TaxID=2321230 RepID=UPI0011C3B547|nr:hypothetical protein [Halococcus sp. IIIV-5B]